MSTTKPSGADVAIEATLQDTGASGPVTVRASAPAVGSGSAPDGQPARGDSIGRFVVLGLLGSGGMGNVYSAYDPHLDRKVAIKLLHAETARTNVADARTRLLREAQAMAKIDHPNVIKVHEVGTLGDHIYVAMEFAEGGTLRAWLKGEHTRRAVLDVFVQAGRGLAAAHKAGLVHRDFKPDNVLLAHDGSVRVTDFGLVSVIGEHKLSRAPTPPVAQPEPPDRDELLQSHSQSTPLSQELTRTGSIMGTPGYMAPEQFAGGESTARTDQFAFCVAVYEAIYRERPFAGDTFGELAAQVATGNIRPAPKGTSVPSSLRRPVLRGLANKPEDRYPTIDELLVAISPDSTRRKRSTLLLAALFVAVSIGITVYSFQSPGGADCSAGAERVATVWNAKTRSALQTAFRTSGRSLAQTWFANGAKQLDQWSSTWQDAYVDACTATHVRGDQSEHLLDLRVQCLTRRLDDTRATIDQIVVGGADAIDHSLEALHALPSLALCGDSNALLAAVSPPENVVAGIQVTAVRMQIGNARALDKLGRYKQAVPAATEALAAARTTHYAPVIAEAGLVLGRTQYDAGDRTSPDTLREAMHAAAEAGDELVMLNAASQLVTALANRGTSYEAAQDVAGLAEAFAHHNKQPAEQLVRLETAIGLLDSKRGKLADAQARYEHALALAAPLGEDHETTLTTLQELATVLMQRGKLQDARAAYQRVLTARERMYGADHPEVATALNSLANIDRRQAKYDDAKRGYERALAIRTAALGPDHPDVATSFMDLGNFYGDIGDSAQAKQNYMRALAINEKAYGPDSNQVAAVLSNLGSVEHDGGDDTSARTHLARAVALVEALQGKDGDGLITPLNNLAVLLQDEHKLDDALAMFERVRTISERANGADSIDVADTLAKGPRMVESVGHRISLRGLMT